MQYRRHRSLLAGLALATGLATAETVVLKNGFRLNVAECAVVSGTAKLRLSSGGWIEVSAGEVLRVEPDSTIPAETERPTGDSGETEAAPSLEDQIDRSASEAALPGELVRAVIWAESGARQDAVSPKGAVGLMQLMPGTAADLGVDPRDPLENIDGGTRYLRQLLERYEGEPDQLERALAAYNAGPGRVAEHGGLPPYPETVGYVARVVRRFLQSIQTDAGDRAGTGASK